MSLLTRNARRSDVRVIATDATVVQDSAEVAGKMGWRIIIGFFVVLGGWAMLAPLNGAVVAEGVVKVDGNRKRIQHLEGGIVKEVRVREGDVVRAGDPLLVLDDTQARTDVEVLDQAMTGYLMTMARLQAEEASTEAVPELPSELAARASESKIAAQWAMQRSLFATHRQDIDSQRRLIGQRIAQIDAQVLGTRAQIAGQTGQLSSLRQELATLKPLLAQGIVTRPRLMQLERSIAAIEGQIGELEAGIARAEQAKGEQQQIEVQSRIQRANQIGQELRDVQSRIAEVAPKLSNARSVLARTVVSAPYAGRIVDLNVFAVGGVIGRGERLMDIVPEGGTLIVEARLGVEHAAEVTVGKDAQVRLAGSKQQATHPLRGTVTHVSADRLVDDRSGQPYYAATVHIAASELSAVPRFQAGMAAHVVIPTQARTAFQYLTAPLLQAFDDGMRER